LNDVRSITDRTLQQVRDLSQLLHPSLLDDLGLAFRRRRLFAIR